MHAAGDAAHHKVPGPSGAHPEQHRRSSFAPTKHPMLKKKINTLRSDCFVFLTPAGTAEHEELSRSLALIKDTIVQVDAQVNLHEKSCRLRDIHSKMEPKAQGKIKDGRVFRREDLAQGRRRLLHDGTVNWKAASGRLKGDPAFPNSFKCLLQVKSKS